jgi:hypothetical protein
MDKLRIRAIAAVAALTVFAPSHSLAAAPPLAGNAAASSNAGEWGHGGVLVEIGHKQASGLSGRWRKVVDLDTGRMRETADFGVFSTTEVWDGRNYWRQDASGGVHPVDSAFMSAWEIKTRRAGPSPWFGLPRGEGSLLNCGLTK